MALRKHDLDDHNGIVWPSMFPCLSRHLSGCSSFSSSLRLQPVRSVPLSHIFGTHGVVMSKYEQLLQRLFTDGHITISIVLNGKPYLVEYAFSVRNQVTTWVDGVFLQKWTELIWPTAAKYPEGQFLCLYFTVSGSRLTRFWPSPDHLIDHLHRHFPDFEIVRQRKPILTLVSNMAVDQHVQQRTG